MTVEKERRAENHKTAFRLMLGELGDRAMDIAFLDSEKPPFNGQVLRTKWEELVRQGRVAVVGSLYRLTPNWPTLDEFAFVAEREKSTLNGFRHRNQGGGFKVGVLADRQNATNEACPRAAWIRANKREGRGGRPKNSSAQREKEMKRES